MDKVLHVLPMNKMSGAERMALLICKNMKQYEPVVVCGGENLSNIFIENGIKSYNIKFLTKNLLGSVSNLNKIIKSENIKNDINFKKQFISIDNTEINNKLKSYIKSSKGNGAFFIRYTWRI